MEWWVSLWCIYEYIKLQFDLPCLSLGLNLQEGKLAASIHKLCSFQSREGKAVTDSRDCGGHDFSPLTPSLLMAV